MVIPATALLASILTFFSGFGLGTLLTPVFALFFPLPEAIALTAVVHFVNNISKLAILFKMVDRKVLFQFGIVSLFMAILGARVLGIMDYIPQKIVYQIFGHDFQTTWLKLGIGAIIILFTWIEWSSSRVERWFSGKGSYIAAGLSGFFGGMSGHQGALRSAFLIKLKLSKEAFIATGTAMAVLVDMARIPVYLGRNWQQVVQEKSLLMATLLASLMGVVIGRNYLKKLTIGALHKLVSAFVVLVALLLIMGII